MKPATIAAKTPGCEAPFFFDSLRNAGAMKLEEVRGEPTFGRLARAD
jgi:hypothetical protein